MDTWDVANEKDVLIKLKTIQLVQVEKDVKLTELVHAPLETPRRRRDIVSCRDKKTIASTEELARPGESQEAINHAALIHRH